MEKELTPEQIVLQEVEATMGTMGWKYLVDDWKAKENQLRDAIMDLSMDDTPKYSLRSLFIAQANMYRTAIETPERLINLFKSNEK